MVNDKKKDQNKNNKSKKKKKKKNKRLSPSWKARIISTGLLYHMDIKQICKIFVQISVHRMGEQE